MYATTFTPSTTIPTVPTPQPSTNSAPLTVVGARQAARLASNIAGVATQWANLTKVGMDAAREACAAAERACVLADCAAVASMEETVRVCAADAWAAAQRAIDADHRVTEAVAAINR